MIADGCLSNCTETCKDNYFTLLTVHDNCDHDDLTQEAEEGVHDLEESCSAFVCNSGITDQLECNEEEHGDEHDGDDGDKTSSARASSVGVASIVMAVVGLAL